MSRNDERKQYEGDVFYEAWRRGMDTDRINPDRVSDAYYDGKHYETFVSELQERNRRLREQREMEEMEQVDNEDY